MDATSPVTLATGSSYFTLGGIGCTAVTYSLKNSDNSPHTAGVVTIDSSTGDVTVPKNVAGVANVYVSITDGSDIVR